MENKTDEKKEKKKKERNEKGYRVFLWEVKGPQRI